MRNSELARLNFERLLHYGGQPKVQCSYDPPLACSGYCVSCEQKGLLEGLPVRLDQISHAADTADFEEAFGRLLPGESGAESGAESISAPVAFVLESPGGYKGNGVAVAFDGYRKQPPVNHYYWMSDQADWPASSSDVLMTDNKYGPYFTYLIWRFQLKNAYITNIVKCSLAPLEDDQFLREYPEPILRNCAEQFLAEEFRLFTPRVVFAFGSHAHRMLRKVQVLSEGMEVQELFHPAARMNRQELIRQNDSSIQLALTRAALCTGR